MDASLPAPPIDGVIGEIVDTCVLMRTRLVSRVITNIFDAELRPFGLNAAQFALLVVISKLSPATATQIGRFHHQDKSTLTRNLKIMFAEGWIAEDRDLASGRSRPIILPKAGEELLQAVALAGNAGQRPADKVLCDTGGRALADVANRLLSS